MTATLVGLFAKFWPAVVGVLGLAAGALWGWAKTKSADVGVARSGQQVAEAQADAARAAVQATEMGESEAQANAAAARAGAQATKERIDAENNTNALPAGGAARIR